MTKIMASHSQQKKHVTRNLVIYIDRWSRSGAICVGPTWVIHAFSTRFAENWGTLVGRLIHVTSQTWYARAIVPENTTDRVVPEAELSGMVPDSFRRACPMLELPGRRYPFSTVLSCILLLLTFGNIRLSTMSNHGKPLSHSQFPALGIDPASRWAMMIIDSSWYDAILRQILNTGGSIIDWRWARGYLRSIMLRSKRENERTYAR